MALSHSRRIVVRDLTFQWKFKGKNDRWGGSPRNALVAIMLEKNGKGNGSAVAWLESTVWVNSDFHDGDTGSRLHKARFTPGDVRLLIETALDTGWDPETRGRWEFPAGLKLTDFQTCER